jgi:hypothetical protein
MDEARYRKAERRLWESVGVIPTDLGVGSAAGRVAGA